MNYSNAFHCGHYQPVQLRRTVMATT